MNNHTFSPRSTVSRCSLVILDFSGWSLFIFWTRARRMGAMDSSSAKLYRSRRSLPLTTALIASFLEALSIPAMRCTSSGRSPVARELIMSELSTRKTGSCRANSGRNKQSNMNSSGPILVFWSLTMIFMLRAPWSLSMVKPDHVENGLIRPPSWMAMSREASTTSSCHTLYESMCTG